MAFFTKVLLLSLLLASTTAAQVVVQTNKINGRVRLSNTNPDILAALLGTRKQGLSYVYAYGLAIGQSTSLLNYTYKSSSDLLEAPFQATVETAPGGIGYELQVYAYSDSSREYMLLPKVKSPLVYPPPADPVDLTIDQCVHLVQVNFKDNAGAPINIVGLTMKASAERSTGDFSDMRAHQYSVSYQQSVDYLSVPASSAAHKITVLFDIPIANSKDQMRSMCETTVIPSCDTITKLDCLAGTQTQIGSIAGQVDLVGESERATPWGGTGVYAIYGPYENQRSYHFTTEPAQGNFIMNNVTATTLVTPEKKYWVFADLYIRSGVRKQWFRTPILGYGQRDVSVYPGATTDLEDLFVIKPGYVRGDIALVGPTQGSAGSPCLAYAKLEEDIDYNNDGKMDNIYPTRSKISFYGSGDYRSPSSMNAYGGYAMAAIDGHYDDYLGTFTGSYEVAMGGLRSEPSLWSPGVLDINFDNTANAEAAPESYHNSHVYLYENLYATSNPYLTIKPGEVTRKDYARCFSEVQLTYQSNSSTFYGPHVNGSGNFVGIDFKGDKVDQYLGYYAEGTPTIASKSSNRGRVVMCVPQGQHRLYPGVRSRNNDGSDSVTQLKPLDINVGCQQRISLSTSLRINLEQLPVVTRFQTIKGAGTVFGDAPVTEVTLSVNDGPAQPLCTNCGVNPKFTFTTSLVEGINKLAFVARDSEGNSSDIEGRISYEPLPLEIEGCSDQTLEAAPGSAGASAEFTVVGKGGCSEQLTTKCSAPSGSLFKVGTTDIRCSVSDSCGAEVGCGFTITVQSPLLPEPTPTPLPPPPVEAPSPTPTTTPPAESGCPVESQKPLISCGVTTDLLWPPNHRMVNSGHRSESRNSCNGQEDAVLSQVLTTGTTVWSDETEIPQSGDGSGNTAPDAQLSSTSLQLRSERRGTGNGRVYLIISKATNSVGAAAHACCTVAVPHAWNAASKAAVLEEAAAARSFCEAAGRAPGNYTQHGVATEIKERAAKDASNSKTGKKRAKKGKKKNK